MNAVEDKDPLLEELEEARARIFARCDNDPEKVLDYYMQIQEQYADRLIGRQPRSAEDRPAA